MVNARGSNGDVAREEAVPPGPFRSLSSINSPRAGYRGLGRQRQNCDIALGRVVIPDPVWSLDRAPANLLESPSAVYDEQKNDVDEAP